MLYSGFLAALGVFGFLLGLSRGVRAMQTQANVQEAAAGESPSVRAQSDDTQTDDGEPDADTQTEDAEPDADLQTDAGEMVAGTIQEDTGDAADDAEEQETEIRVLLLNQEETGPLHDNILLTGGEGLAAVIHSSDGTETGTVLAAGGEILDMQELLKAGESALVTAQEGGRICMVSIERDGYHPSYEGTLTIRHTEGGFTAVSCVPLETYLAYVVPSEMPSSYPAEALRAQAILARTYAVRSILDGGIDGYDADVDDSVSCQVYAHIDRQDETDAAVGDTEGILMLYDGEPCRAYFYSTSCGWSSPADIWGDGEGAPYLTTVSVNKNVAKEGGLDGSVESAAQALLTDIRISFDALIREDRPGDYEAEDAWYRWRAVISREEIAARCQSQYPSIGKFVTLSVESRTQAGAADCLLLCGSDGQERIYRELAIRRFLSPAGQSLYQNDGSAADGMQMLPSGYFVLEDSPGEGILTVYGGGYGHGVGMSQNGARHMAQDGMDWKSILNYFFRGVSFGQAEETAKNR